MKVAVIGAGSWGTALAKLMAEREGNSVKIWAFESAVRDEINNLRQNSAFLPGFTLPENIKATDEIEETLKGAEITLLVTPSHVLRGVLERGRNFFEPETPIVCCSKGIETQTLSLMSEVMEEVLPERLHPYMTFLSGPSFAREVAAGQPTVVTIAGYMEKIATKVQEAISGGRFRAYRSTDIPGVETGGAVKNVIAIATGVAAGLGLGDNTRAALITRGLAEITRLAVKKGGDPATLSGPAGLGDLVLTCSGELSRNRTVGFRLGRGEKLKDILGEMTMVAEGVKTAHSTRELAQKLEVEMPITNVIYDILYNDKSPEEAVRELMSRSLKREHWGY